MERTLTPDEKIRRAEEIYYRKKIQASNRSCARVNVAPKKEYGLLKKMILQILICMLIYTIFYMIKNSNYIFSEDVIKRTEQILSYDINIQKLYNQTKDYINSFIIENKEINKPTNTLEEQNIISEESISAEHDNTERINNLVQENEASIEEPQEKTEEQPQEQSQAESLTQMEQDAKYILENVSLIIPLKGTITSRYGPRNPTTPTVPKNHTGIDIAVNEGTVFIASMAGTVETVSSEGDYRKSCKNCKWRCNDFICAL